jgi:hypothetical protein
MIRAVAIGAAAGSALLDVGLSVPDDGARRRIS